MRAVNETYIHASDDPGLYIACVVHEFPGRRPYPALTIGQDCTIFPSFAQLAAIRDAITAVLDAREIDARAIVSGEAA